MPIEWAAAARVLIRRSQHAGTDPIEVLNHGDLLLTPYHERRLQVEALQRFADELDRWQAHEMLRREMAPGNPGTPADMYRAVRKFLDEFIQYRKEKDW